MAQVPLAPPPPTGGPIDGWLYLLWKRVTAAGQILWSSILPGTSADVAAAVTDETGSPGSLVFSGNPTLQGLNVTTAAFTSRGITDNATATALTIANASIPVAGIGTTPKTSWTVFGGVMQIGSQLSLIGNATGGGGQYNNSYYDGTERFIATGAHATRFLTQTIGDISFWASTASGTADAAITWQENGRIAQSGVATLGGASATPALKVTPVASQARWIEVTGATSGANPQLATTAGELLLPQSIVLPKTSGKGIQVDTASPSFGWRDIIGQIGVKTSGATDPVWTAYRGSIYAYTFDSATTEAFMVFHIPHDYVPSSDMFIHAHWSTNVVATGNVEWNFDITYADGHGTAGGAADPFIAPITVTVVQQASTTQYGHMIAEVQFTNAGGTGGLIDSATIQVDGLLLVRIYRIKTNAADTLSQSPFVHTADVHYQSTNIGTKQKAPNFYT